jgi:hypothetical protein
LALRTKSEARDPEALRRALRKSLGFPHENEDSLADLVAEAFARCKRRQAEPAPPPSTAQEVAGALAQGRQRADTCCVRRLIATLLAALASTVIFAVIQSNRHLEDSPFIHALLAFSTVAFALAVASLPRPACLPSLVSGFGRRGVPSRPAPFRGLRRSPRGLCLHHRRADVLRVTHLGR